VPVPVPLKRVAYRIAYRVLQVVWMVRRPAKVGVKCLLVHDGRILLVRHTYGDRAWDLPGGALKRREEPLAAARREMREELGIKSAGWTSLGAVRGTVHHRRDLIHCYRAELAQPEVTIDPGELATSRWFAPGELPSELAPYVAPILAHAPREARPPSG
jgi:8-oxo-dGTP pyrophosphatase MutT (NUDIX family)